MVQDAQLLVRSYKDSLERVLGPGATIHHGTKVLHRHPQCGPLALFVYPSDPARFQLVLPALLHSEQGLARHGMVELCNAVNGMVHGVKFFVGAPPRGEVSAAVELLVPMTDAGCPHQELLDGMMRRSTAMLLEAAHRFGATAIAHGVKPQVPARATAHAV